jgi:ribosome biogenesis GTPase
VRCICDRLAGVIEDLHRWGWSDALAQSFAEHEGEALHPGRVLCRHGRLYDVLTATGRRAAVCTGKVRHVAADAAGLPAVGDWVVARSVPGDDRVAILAVLPRKSAFVRQSAGTSGAPQVVAANVDTVFLLMGLDADYNLRRLQRYMTLAHDSGARPVVVLNKADVDAAAAEHVAAVRAAHPDAEVCPVSALRGDGLAALEPYVAAGQTVAVLGSSGAGKSTLVNALLGRSTQATGEVRASDGRGRHTTTRRDLIDLPGRGMIMDTPGMRELQLGDAEPGLEGAFGAVVDVAARCRFGDCAHQHEPGCAVQAAMAAGSLRQDEVESYLRLQREIAARSARGREDAKRRAKTLGRAVKRLRR